MKRYHGLYTLLIATLLCCFHLSCDELLELVPITPPGDEAVDIHFVLSAGGDSIGADTPLTVAQGDTLSVAVSQRSSYTDPDGTVFTCEPQARVRLFTKVDTVYAQNIESLLRSNAPAETTTAQSGTNPVQHTTLQRFTIGGQEVVFDLAHEVYTYVNSLSEEVEMPYIKVGEAQLGSSNTEGTRSVSPAVSLKSLSLTRVSVVDSAMFEVSAKFSLALESVNTPTESKQTLEFTASYVGVVESVTELYGSIAYTISDENGEAKSPFVVNGSDSLLLEICQKSTYATPDTAVYVYEPKATISLRVKNDTAFVERPELLDTLVEAGEPRSSQCGENPVASHYQQLFATSSQEFLFETMYEVYNTQRGDEMPYMAVGEPRCLGIEVTPREQDVATRGFVYDTVYYDVKAQFEVGLTGVNISDELIDALKFEVNYVGAVINATEVVELVKTTYRKKQVFLEGHDNLLPASQCQVFRDRHYSDGHVETDEFYGTPWMWVEIGYGAGITRDWYVKDTTIVHYPDFSVTYGPVSPANLTFDFKNAYTLSCSTTQISNWEYIEKEDIVIRKDTISNYDGTYEKEFENYFFDPANPEEGWYMKKYVEIHDRLLKYTNDGKNKCFRYYSMGINYYDRFLCIDDTIIGFEEFRPELKWADTFEEYGGSDTRGPGKIFKFEVTGKYLDQDVYIGVVDTIYTPKDPVKIFVHLDEPTDVTSSSATLHARVEGHEGQVFSQYGFYLARSGDEEKWVYLEADDVAADGSTFSVTVSGLEREEQYRYYAQVDVPLTLSATPLRSNTQSFTARENIDIPEEPEEPDDRPKAHFAVNLSNDDAVDLGLSVKWSSRNMGANTPEEYGEFYSWSPDAVAAAWGGQWRMPTKEEAEELRDNCVFVWGEQNGVGGMYVIGPNGNAIFMPTVYIEYVYMGDWEGKAQYMENSTNPQYGIGEFWTSTQGADGKVDYMSFSHDGSTWARREQGDVREWATFTFPDGQESERRFEKEHLPRMFRSADLHWRKSIRPVRR